MYVNADGEIVYCKGDRVTVRRDALVSWHEYPTGHKGEALTWGDGMKDYCGKTVTISSRIRGCKYRIEEDDGYWTWCNTFFEAPFCLESEDNGEIEPPNISKFLSSFSVNS